MTERIENVVELKNNVLVAMDEKRKEGCSNSTDNF